MIGETLAARIEKGALPLDQALKYAVQIADALDRAHRAGVTHRDVKPQNIMLTRDGVKVLDFGLAKSTAKPAPNQDTLTAVLTTEGTVLGTPQYMAPEQFEGKEADARSDIWAFGAVLYEMVTGRKAFQGKSYTSLVAAILGGEPAPMAVKPFTPTWLERLVRRCLEKDPDDRWQSMRDVVLELRSPPVEVAAVTPKAVRWPWAVAAAGMVLAAIGVWLMAQSRQVPAPERARRLQLNPPEGGNFDASHFAMSPDGQSVAFFATAPGKSGLWVRPLDAAEARLLPGTGGGRYPFWSPDGRALAYQASGKLWRVEVGGGAPIAICDADNNMVGGAWSAGGDIVFGTFASGLRRVPASGGTPETFTTPDTARGEGSHRRPQLLPGRRILFQVRGTPERAGIYAASLAKPREAVRLVATGVNGLYAAGHLLWLRGSTLVAQPFDPDSLQLSGEPRPVADSVGTNPQAGMVASASAAHGGLLVHGRREGSQLTWLDHPARAAPSDKRPLGPMGYYSRFRISPDGRRVAVARASGVEIDLWRWEVERDVWSRFTFLQTAMDPVWSPDGRQIIFRSGAPQNIYRKDASGAGAEQRVTESPHPQFPTDWSRDGRLLLYHEQAPDTRQDLWVLPVTPDGRPQPNAQARPYLRTRFNERGGRFSPEPNPRWVAYHSDESGRDEVYVQAFPEPRGKFQISTSGGLFPEWSPDGRELYYLGPGRKLMAVALKLGADSVQPSTPRELFTMPPFSFTQPYALAPDGKRFLVSAPVGGSQPLEVVVNWTALLKQSAGSSSR